MNYEFTRNWFNNSAIKKKIKTFINSKNINKILEIGSWEGQSSVYFSDSNDISFRVTFSLKKNLALLSKDSV